MTTTHLLREAVIRWTQTSSIVPSIFIPTSLASRASFATSPSLPHLLVTFSCRLLSILAFLLLHYSGSCSAAMSDRYYHLDAHERGGAPRHVPRHEMPQPRYKQPVRPCAPRDRYRATQYDNPMYDIVEDEETCGGFNTPFDSFGK